MDKIDVKIGKYGIKETVILEIKKRLDKKDEIKIKLLRSFISMIKSNNKKQAIKEVAELIAKKTNSKVSSIIGYVITIKKSK